MSKHDKPDKKEKKEEKPYLQFRYCKTKCFACNECGYFWGPDSKLDGQRASWTDEKPQPNLYTAESVRVSLAPKWDNYYAKLSIGQTEYWKPDQRTVELFALSQWISEELTKLRCPDEDRRRQLWLWNRKSRAEDDLYNLAAMVVNGFLMGNVDNYKGK